LEKNKYKYDCSWKIIRKIEFNSVDKIKSSKNTCLFFGNSINKSSMELGSNMSKRIFEVVCDFWANF
jgi:hypothetical protein